MTESDHTPNLFSLFHDLVPRVILILVFLLSECLLPISMIRSPSLSSFLKMRIEYSKRRTWLAIDSYDIKGLEVLFYSLGTKPSHIPMLCYFCEPMSILQILTNFNAQFKKQTSGVPGWPVCLRLTS